MTKKPGPWKLERNYPRYHEMEEASPGEGRAAIVELRVDGWSAKAIAGHLGVHRSTVYRTLERFNPERYDNRYEEVDGGFGRSKTLMQGNE